MLKDCHRRIERFVGMLARVADQASGRALTFQEHEAVEAALRYFRESGPRHSSDEEQSLFPRLEGMADVQADIARLEGEHQEADALHAVCAR
jgi:hemerythrin-like domain-containing protein